MEKDKSGRAAKPTIEGAEAEFERRLAVICDELRAAHHERRWGLVQLHLQAGNFVLADFGKRLKFDD